MITLVIIDVFFLPYTFGKSVRDTDVSEVLVYHDLDNLAEKPVHGFVLHQSKSELALLHIPKTDR